MIRIRGFLQGMTLALMGAAQSPAQVLDYTGRVHVDGVKFNGKGFFVFSIQDTSGEILWASGDFPQAGATRNPVAAWQIIVKDGVYQKRLGDTASGMPAIDTARLFHRELPDRHFRRGGRVSCGSADTPVACYQDADKSASSPWQQPHQLFLLSTAPIMPMNANITSEGPGTAATRNPRLVKSLVALCSGW